jgi:hypothetical protein
MKKEIPQQRAGKTVDYYKSVSFNLLMQTDRFYDQVKQRLLDVNNWHKISEGPSAKFSIVDADGTNLSKSIEKNDYIKIDIPGPGLPSSKGYDWVQVDQLINEVTRKTKKIVLTLRPCKDPTNTNNDTAHFFKDIASSSITIEQHNNNVFLHYAGRNEVVNTDNKSSLDNIRNFIIGLATKIGASYPQWKTLIDGLGRIDKTPSPTKK